MENIRHSIRQGQSPLSMIIFSSVGVIVIGLIFQFLGVLLTTLFFNVSFVDLVDIYNVESREIIHAIKFLQIFGALGTFVFSSFLLSYFYTGSWTGFFTFGRRISGKAAFLLVLIMIVALPFINLLTDLNMRFHFPFEAVENYLRKMEEQTNSLMMTLIQADNIGALLVNLFMIAIIPAIGEELVFRGLIQKHFMDLFKNKHLAIIITSVVFSLAHFQVYSFIPRFFLGMILGYAFYYGKTLWYPMLAHLVNNTMGVLFYYFTMKNQSGEFIESIGTNEQMPLMALVSLILIVGMIIMWIKIVTPNRSVQQGQI